MSKSRTKGLIVQVSLPYNKTGRASVLCSFIVGFLRGFCGLNTLFKILAVFPSFINRFYIVQFCIIFNEQF